MDTSFLHKSLLTLLDTNYAAQLDFQACPAVLTFICPHAFAGLASVRESRRPGPAGQAAAVNRSKSPRALRECSH